MVTACKAATRNFFTELFAFNQHRNDIHRINHELEFHPNPSKERGRELVRKHSIEDSRRSAKVMERSLLNMVKECR